MYAVCRFLLFKQKTAYEMRISDWSSDVCSSDLPAGRVAQRSTSPPPAAPPRPAAPVHVVAPPEDEIIVTASKADTPYSRFAGVATSLDGDDLAFGGERGTDSDRKRVV